MSATRPTSHRDGSSVKGARRLHGKLEAHPRLGQFFILALFLVVWHLSSGRLVDSLFVSDPVSVIRRLAGWTADGSLLLHTWTTFYEAVAGFVIGSLIGIALGILLGVSTFLSRLMSPFIFAFNALPKIALAPLIILWVGLGADSKIVFVAVVVFFLSFYNTFSGIREVDRDLIDTARIMKSTRRQLLTKVMIPSAGSWIFAGLQMSVPYALIGAILGEMIAADAGLGFLLARAGASFDTTGVFAALVVTSALAVLVHQAVEKLQSRLESWKVVAG